jgi:hypothetical protein
VSTQSGFTVRHLVPAVAVASLALSLPAGAAKFDLGPFEATFTSRLSVGASWRVEDTDNAFVSPGNTQGFGRASSSTTDDGDLNYGQGDMYSLLFKGVHDLDLNAGNWGFFTRVKYWYDYAQANDTVPHGHAATNYTPNDHLDMSRFEPLARDQGFQFLDYYLYGDFDIGNKPLELRAGNMVLNWGENLFIQNGVSVIAPFDVTALRRPGSEIREALLPVGMVYANFGATDNLSLEAFYQYDWDRAILDECGTYWNAADPYGGGCDYLTVSAADPDASQVGTTVINRGGDVEPEDSGQFGISARYFAESLNSTEFGFYYLNVHNRTPIFSGINTEEGLGGNILNPAVQPKYFFDFTEDIETFGVSFTTNLGFWAWAGELSYKPEFPLQINTTDFLQALSLGSLAEWSPMLQRSLDAGAGGVINGYDEVEYTQFQTSFIRFFEQVWGADRISVAAEIGATWIDGMDPNVNYGRSATFGVAGFEPFESAVFPGVEVSCNDHPVLAPLGIVPNPNAAYCTGDGFTTDFSWGYRVRASATYNGALGGINLTPNMAWSHDVDGYSPAPNFVEGRQALSLGLRADYLAIYQAEISYTSFFGADYNELADRDFLSLSFSVAF